ncbi:MAG TPA: MFS transporter [Acidimicrobiales bacterium]|jgi:MFS family permease|nr:MFS transporter [Acidimicrobiales bacterium]
MPGPDDRYKWIALSNTTLGVFMASVDASIVIISLPAIFRGINLNPLQASNISYLLWLLQGYLVVTAVLVVTLGRLGDMLGRVRIYNAGFAIFTVASIGLSLTWSKGAAGALEMIVMRVVQGIGGSMLLANSTAILTDAFPVEQRGMAMGINQIAGLAGSFIGLIAGGLLADIDWRLVFWVSVPVGVFGTVWAYRNLHETSSGRRVVRLDWWGNLTFAVGLVSILIGITYGIQPYGHHTMGWSSPTVLAELIGGVVVLGIFAAIEAHSPEPMFNLRLFKIRAFLSGNMASLLSSIGRGGLQFVLIIWLQGIWLPLHGYSFDKTPLWAGMYMLPLTGGFLLAGPISGALSDRYGARPFSTGGMVVAAATFLLLMELPANFGYPVFALLLFANGIGFGLFAAPNTTAVMNSVPPEERGAASGMRATFQNSGMVLSIGLFFSFMIAGLASSLPGAMRTQLIAHGVPVATATTAAHLPPVGSLFAAFLGFNPISSLLGPHVLSSLPPANAAYLTGKTFFPNLIAGPFMDGLRLAFISSAVMCLVAAAASWLRGGRFVYTGPAATPVAPAPSTADRTSESEGAGGSPAREPHGAKADYPLVR